MGGNSIGHHGELWGHAVLPVAGAVLQEVQVAGASEPLSIPNAPAGAWSDHVAMLHP